MPFRRLLIALLPLLLSCVRAQEALVFLPVAEKPRVQSPAVTEASGLAISPTDPDFMWIINDSGGTPQIHLLNTDGTDRGSVTLKDCRNIDWEDLAAFRLDGKNYLLVADTGDNNAKRDSCILNIVAEPALPAAGERITKTIAPAWQIQFRYEDGPRDCESVAVDVVGGKILLISKRAKPPYIYELPLRAPAKPGIQTARKQGAVNIGPSSNPLIPFLNQPTALDITGDGLLAAVITYNGLLLFPRGAQETWSEAFSREPISLRPHGLSQAESVAFAGNGNSIYAVAEGRNSPVIRYTQKR